MTTGLKDPEATINSFINAFYKDQTGYAFGRYGLMDKSYTIDDNHIVPLNPPFVDLLGDLPYLFDNENQSDEYKQIRDLSARNMLSSNVILFKNKDKLSIKNQFNNMLIDSFFGVYDSVSPEELIAQYRRKMKTSGAQELLDKLNEDAGTTALYGY